MASVAAERGPLAMEAISLGKDFRLGRGAILHAVRDVSFNLYRGAATALVGESGSGKLTVARLLAGQERLTSGLVRLDGQPRTSRAAGPSGSTRARSSSSSRTRSPRSTRCTRCATTWSAR